jgi:hypothetical protein
MKYWQVIEETMQQAMNRMCPGFDTLLYRPFDLFSLIRVLALSLNKISVGPGRLIFHIHNFHA